MSEQELLIPVNRGKWKRCKLLLPVTLIVGLFLIVPGVLFLDAHSNDNNLYTLRGLSFASCNYTLDQSQVDYCWGTLFSENTTLLLTNECTTDACTNKYCESHYDFICTIYGRDYFTRAEIDASIASISAYIERERSMAVMIIIVLSAILALIWAAVLVSGHLHCLRP